MRLFPGLSVYGIGFRTWGSYELGEMGKVSWLPMLESMVGLCAWEFMLMGAGGSWSLAMKWGILRWDRD